jgi:hypothetical protein
MVVPLKQIVIVLGLMLASTSLAHGQTTEHRLTSSSQPIASSVPISSTRAMDFEAPPVRPDQDFDVHPLVHDDRDFARSSPLRVTKTPFMTESRLPIAQALGSRVQVNFVTMSTNNRKVLLGPLAMPQSTQALAQPRPSNQIGIGLSIPFGRDAGSSGSKDLWRGVSRALHRR